MWQQQCHHTTHNFFPFFSTNARNASPALLFELADKQRELVVHWSSMNKVRSALTYVCNLVGQMSADWQKFEVGLKGGDLICFWMKFEAILSHFRNLRICLLNFFLLQFFDCRIGFWYIELQIKVTISFNLEGAIWNPFYNNTNYFRYNLSSLTFSTFITKHFQLNNLSSIFNG